jgi:type III pantothenate kinase
VILDIDLGNTRIKWRETHRSMPAMSSRAMPVSRISTDLDLALSERPERIRVASVRGAPAKQDLAAWSDHQFGLSPEFACSSAKLAGVTNGYEHPELLGVDRWLALLAGSRLTDGGAVVMDFGTAMTADGLDGSGRHIGGFIAPGIRLMSESLRANTGLVRPKGAQQSALFPGHNTTAAVSGGVLAAAAGFANQAWKLLSAGSGARVALITGGDAELIAGVVDFPFRIAIDLVLDGLAVALP